jgi:hypothetical protein
MLRLLMIVGSIYLFCMLLNKVHKDTVQNILEKDTSNIIYINFFKK